MTPLKPSSQKAAGPCAHDKEPGRHTPFVAYRADCGCGARYELRGCGDAKDGRRLLEPDPKTSGILGLLLVECASCGRIADGGVPPEAIPETISAWGPLAALLTRDEEFKAWCRLCGGPTSTQADFEAWRKATMESRIRLELEEDEEDEFDDDEDQEDK